MPVAATGAATNDACAVVTGGLPVYNRGALPQPSSGGNHESAARRHSGSCSIAHGVSCCSLNGVHPASLQHATNAVAVAFDMNQVPVQVLDDMVGYVASGSFVVEDVWGAGPIEQRVDCGVAADGTPRARLGPVHMSIEAQLRPTNDALARGRAGAAFTNRPTEVRLNAHGELRYEDESYGCGLTEEFGRHLLAAAGVNAGGMIDVPGRVRVVADGAH